MRGNAIRVIIASLGIFAPVYAQTISVTPTTVSVHADFCILAFTESHSIRVMRQLHPR